MEIRRKDGGRLRRKREEGSVRVVKGRWGISREWGEGRGGKGALIQRNTKYMHSDSNRPTDPFGHCYISLYLLTLVHHGEGK